MSSDKSEQEPTEGEKKGIKHDMYLGASAKLFATAKQLRLQETLAEKLLWSRLSRNQLGVSFRRQHPIYTYV
ncbi:MAG TPA: DUF559 domain-containing protein, partial [Chryseolinea sp.]|nr:DUF559 domain-containing protein [Chryseolinea sp.]